MESLREDVCELLRCIDSDQAEMIILDCLVGVLAGVNVLGALTPSDNIVAPLDAHIVVLVDWRPFLWCKPHILQEVSEVNHFNSRRGC